MKDSEFAELVNLYLDNEISKSELQLLQEELKCSLERKKTFAFYRRLHQASCVALSGVAKPYRSSYMWESVPSIGCNKSNRKAIYIISFSLTAACFVLAFVVSLPQLMNEQHLTEIVGQPLPLPQEDNYQSKRRSETNPRSSLVGGTEVTKFLYFPIGIEMTEKSFSREENIFTHLNGSVAQDPFIQINQEERFFPGFEEQPAQLRPVILKNSATDSFHFERTGFTFQR